MGQSLSFEMYTNLQPIGRLKIIQKKLKIVLEAHLQS